MHFPAVPEAEVCGGRVFGWVAFSRVVVSSMSYRRWAIVLVGSVFLRCMWRAVYLLGVTILMLLFANFFFKDLLVFFPRTSIQFSSSEPPHRHSSLVSPLSLSLPLLLSSDALLAKPPMSEEYSLRRLNLMSNCLHILLGRHPLYFLL